MKMHPCLKPAIFAAAVAVALPAAAQSGFRYSDYGNSDVRYDYARVVKVDAIVNHASRPVSRETCWQEPTTYRYNPSYTYYRNDDGDGPEAVTVEGRYDLVSGAQQHCRTETNWRSTDRVLGYLSLRRARIPDADGPRSGRAPAHSRELRLQHRARPGLIEAAPESRRGAVEAPLFLYFLAARDAPPRQRMK
jgi:hypothetical protein